MSEPGSLEKLLAEVLKLAKGRTVECPCRAKGQPVCFACAPRPDSSVVIHGAACYNCHGENSIPDPAFAGLVTVLEWERWSLSDNTTWTHLPPGALRGAIIEAIRTECLRSPGAAWMFYTEGLLQRNFGKGDDDALETLKKALEELPQ